MKAVGYQRSLPIDHPEALLDIDIEVTGHLAQSLIGDIIDILFEYGQPLPVQIQDRIQLLSLSMVDMPPAVDQGFIGKAELFSPLFGVGDGRDDIDFRGPQFFQALFPGAGNVFDRPALLFGDLVKKLLKQTVGLALLVGEGQRRVVVDSDLEVSCQHRCRSAEQ